MTPWLGMSAFLGFFIAVLTTLSVLQRPQRSSPEFTRKALHIVMGLSCLSFTWLFTEAWPVIILGAVSASILVALRAAPALRMCPANVISGVGRKGYGDIYFPLSIALLFTLSQGNPVRFVVPVLILTLADSMAAIVGGRFGQVRCNVPGGSKSLEGSISFFAVAVVCVLIPLLLMTPTGFVEAMLIALVVGLIATIIEAASWHGTDNLTVPLATYALLVAWSI